MLEGLINLLGYITRLALRLREVSFAFAEAFVDAVRRVLKRYTTTVRLR